MNKRYKELEKKATDARRTYEKLLKKYEKSDKEKNQFEIRVSKAEESYESIKKDRLSRYSEEEWKMIETITIQVIELDKFGVDFVANASQETDKIENRCNELDNNIIEMSKQIKGLICTRDEEEKNFKDLWEVNQKSVTEGYAQNVMRKHRQLTNKINQIHVAASRAMYERELLVKKFNKLKSKVNRYKEINDVKEDLIEQFCSYKAASREEVYDYISKMQDMYRLEQDALDQLHMLNGLLQEHISGLNQLKDKLNIAKDKMEEAEYQLTEYKNLINAA